MRAEEPTPEDLIRLLVDSWAALRAGTLEPERQSLLDRERPQWQCEAANLIAEGLLAYVTLEMVEPDLVHARQVDPHDVPSHEEVAARLGAHLRDFVDYRSELPRVRRLTTH